MLAHNPSRAPVSPPPPTASHFSMFFLFRRQEKKNASSEKCSNPITKSGSRAMEILASVRNSYPTFAPPPNVFAFVSFPLQWRTKRNMCDGSEGSKFQQPFNSLTYDADDWVLGRSSSGKLLELRSFWLKVTARQIKNFCGSRIGDRRSTDRIIVRWLNEMR